ncbi:GNAT family N-acetyltransferase [Tsukamurella hominis]|uniref:GNAT family N-acetyltransferase n=1 Tax=Tsukamurella hominis TaxID=1970232 RepID=UPI0039E995CA
MTALSTSDRYRIGEHVVELRAPRLADAASWRRTCLEHEKRLRPAFGSPGTDWDAEHSAAAWAADWWRAHRDPDVLLSRVLTVEDGAEDRVVGAQRFAGRDPRTGHTESSTWIAGLPNSKTVAMWMSARNTLDLFVQNPDLPLLVTPQTTDNKPAMALAEALGFTYLQTLQRLREFDGVPADHTVYYLRNTPDSRRRLESVLESIAAEPLPPRRAPLPTLDVVLGVARAGVRRMRARRAASPSSAGRLPATVRTDDGRTITFLPTSDGRHAVSVGGSPIGGIQIHHDPGSSTIEVIDRLHADAPVADANAAIEAACRASADRQDARRLTIALADRNAAVAEPLAALGFASEGATSPTFGDDGAQRESWTRLQQAQEGRRAHTGQ